MFNSMFSKNLRTTGFNAMNRKKYLAKNTALFALNSIGTKLIIFLLVPCAYNYKKYYSPARISKLIIIILLGIFASFVLDKITIKIDSSSEYINKI